MFSYSKRPYTTGTFRVGKTVKAKVGTWSPTPTSYSYQWIRAGKKISGATSSTYKLTKADKGKKVKVKVTVKCSGYATTSAKSTAKTVKKAS